MAVAVGWICSAASLVYGFSLFRLLAVYAVSGGIAFPLICGFLNSGWVQNGAEHKGASFANRQRSNFAESSSDLVDLEEMARSKPADWMQLLHDRSAVHRGRCFVLADTSNPQSRRLAYDLSLIGFDVDMCDDCDAVFDTFRHKADDHPWSLLVVDLDFLTTKMEMGEIIDDLLSLRMCAMSMSVIILSSDVSGDDSGISRLLVTDATLVAPVSIRRLRQGIWDAQTNNVIWQRRFKGDDLNAVKQHLKGGA